MNIYLLRSLPLFMVILAIGLACIPKTVSYLDVERFFADPSAHYQPARSDPAHKAPRVEDYYFPGVHIGKLWKKLGVARAGAFKLHGQMPLRDEYLFGCSYADIGACILPYPAVEEYTFGAYKALRISSSSKSYPDYQYLFFKYKGREWAYFGHVDVFDNSKVPPDFRLLDNGLASVISLAGAGEGYRTEFIQVYKLDGKAVSLLLATPSRAFRRGIGLLDFDVTADYDYAQGLLTGEYTIRFSATEPSMDASKVLLPLFTVKRTLALKWENGHLAYDNLNSDISPSDIARITSGSYARIYTLFRAEFDKLQKAEGVKWQWFKEFMAVVKDEGVALTAPLSGSPAP